MAETVVHYVLGKIAETAYKEALFLYGVGDKVDWAKRELEWVSAFVKDADAKQNKDARVKQWVKDVKEVAYMIEDALDMFFVEMGGGRSKGVLRRISQMPKAVIERHKVGTAIDEIKERLKEIKVNRENFGIAGLESSSGAPAEQLERPVVVPEIDKTEVVGFKDDVDNICEQLCDQSISRRSVISIVGPGGRGKTTLAIKIYKRYTFIFCYQLNSYSSRITCCFHALCSAGFAKRKLNSDCLNCSTSVFSSTKSVPGLQTCLENRPIPFHYSRVRTESAEMEPILRSLKQKYDFHH